MKREQQEQARLLSELVDGLLLRRRHEDCDVEPGTPDSRELTELRTLAEQLCDVVIVPPEHFGETLLRRLPVMSIREAERRRTADWSSHRIRMLADARTGCARVLRSACTRFSFALPSAAFAVLIAIVLVIGRLLLDTPVASAGEILSRSDAALSRLVHPGQLLYRRWKVTTLVTEADGLRVRRGARVIHEWMDGADFDRVAGRWYSEDERLLIAYTSVGQGGERRPNVYFSPGVFGEEQGVLSIEPTREEFGDAVYSFPEAIQGALRVYLDRQYIYLPITGERRYNRAILEAPRQDLFGMPRMVLSLDPSETWKGTPVYRVRVVDPASIEFNWRSEGPPRVRLVQAEIVCYIARDSYLGVRTEETEKFENGRRMLTTKELVETRAVSAANLPLDPFKLDVPDGTPVQRQSAWELLSGVASALSRLPQFNSTLEEQNGRQ